MACTATDLSVDNVAVHAKGSGPELLCSNKQQHTCIPSCTGCSARDANVLSAAAVVVGWFASLVMSYGIGANDVANAFASSVGSKALHVWQAVVLAGIFEVCASSAVKLCILVTWT